MFGRKKKTKPEADKTSSDQKAAPEKGNTIPPKQVEPESESVPEKRGLKDRLKVLSKPVKIGVIILSVVLIGLAAFFVTRSVLLPRYQHYKVRKGLIGSAGESVKIPSETDSTLINPVTEKSDKDSVSVESDRTNSKTLSLAAVIILISLTVIIASLATFFITRTFLVPKKQSEDDKGESEQKEIPLAVKILAIALMIIIFGTAAFLITKVVLLPRYQRYKVMKEFVQNNTEKEKPKKEPKREMGQIFDIKDLTVNTFGSGGRRFIVAEFAIETHSKETYDELGLRAPQIRDMIINYLRHYTADQILSLSFQETSRSELTRNINALLYNGPIDSLYYSTLVIQ